LWSLTACAAIVLLVLAVDNRVYLETSPTTLSGHVFLRKVYSVVAFALVGFGAARARRASAQPATPILIGAMIAAYSALIEVLQFFLDPPPEGLAWNAIDVACGFIGGWLAAFAAGFRARPMYSREFTPAQNKTRL
jgi:hypothetical protein